MATSSDEIVMTGNATQLLEAYKQVNAAILKQTEESRAAARQSKEADAEQTRMAKEAAKVWEQTLKPIERYKIEVDKLKALLQEGAISQEVFNRAMERQREIFAKEKAATPEARAAAAKKEAEETEKAAARKRELADEEAARAKSEKENQEANARALKKLEDAEKAALQRKKELRAEGERMRQSNLTPLERYNAEVARASQLLKKGVIDQQTFNRELDKQKEILRQSQPQVEGLSSKLLGFGKEALIAFTGVGGAIAGIMAAANVLKSEYEGLRQRMQEAKDSQLSFGEQIRELASNFREDDTMTTADLEPAVKRLMIATGASDTTAAGALSAAFAGHGNLTNAQAVDIAEQALRVLPNNAEASNQIALRAGQLMNAAGLQDPRQALGIITQIKNVATVDKLRDVGQSAVPAVMSAIRYGDTPEVGAELYTTINNLMGDVEGARTSTAFIGLAEQLREFDPTKKQISESRLSRDAIARLKAATSTKARLGVLQEDPKLAQFFLDNASFEKQAVTAIRELVMNSPEAQAQAALAEREIRAPNADDFESYIAGLDAPSSQDLFAKANRARNNVKLRELQVAAEGGAGQAQEIFDKALGKVDWSGPDFVTTSSARRDAANQIMWGADSADAFASTLESAYLGAGGQSTVSAEDTNYLKQQIELLREIARSNKEMSRQPASPAVPPENALGRQ